MFVRRSGPHTQTALRPNVSSKFYSDAMHLLCDVTVGCYIPQLHALPLPFASEHGWNCAVRCLVIILPTPSHLRGRGCVEPSIRGNIHYAAQCLVFSQRILCFNLTIISTVSSSLGGCAQHFYADAAATKQKECSPSINIHFASAAFRTLPAIPCSKCVRAMLGVRRIHRGGLLRPTGMKIYGVFFCS